MEQIKHFSDCNQIERCFAILELMAEQNEELSVKEVSEYFGASPSSVHRLLQQLVKLDYLEQDPSSRRYYMGIKMFEIAQLVINQKKPLLKTLEPILQEFYSEIDENTYFFVHSPKGPRTLIFLRGNKPIGVNTRPPVGRAFHATSSGKLFLANCAPSVIDNYIKQGLPKYTDNTIVTPEALKAELKRIREQGYALDKEEHWQGVRCVSVPVVDDSGSCVAQISVQMPAIRYSDLDETWLINRMKAVAENIRKTWCMGVLSSISA